MNEMKISVIVPVYNVEDYIEYSIRSLVEQTFDGYEIILVNDGSTDQSEAICRKQEAIYKNIRVLSKDNGGLSDARNYGIRHARGEYILFVDGDDWVDSHMLSDFWEAKIKTGADIVIGRHIEGREEQLAPRKCGEAEPQALDSRQALELMCYEREFGTTACCKLFPKKFLEETAFPKGKRYEDLFTVYQLLAKTDNIVYLPQIYYFYRIRTNSIRNSKWNEQVWDVMEAARALLEFYRPRGEELYLAAVQRYFFSANEVYVRAFEEKNYRQIVRPLQKELITFKVLMRKNRKINKTQRLRYEMMMFMPGFYRFIWKMMKG